MAGKKVEENISRKKKLEKNGWSPAAGSRIGPLSSAVVRCLSAAAARTNYFYLLLLLLSFISFSSYTLE